MPSLPPLPPSYVHLVRHYEREIHASYALGIHSPIIFPYHLLPFLTIVFYLLLEPSRSRVVRIYRYASFAFFTWWSIYCMTRLRTPTPLAAYGLGLVNAWSIIWLGALIVFNDIKDLRRVWAVRDAPTGEGPAAILQLKEQMLASDRELQSSTNGSTEASANGSANGSASGSANGSANGSASGSIKPNWYTRSEQGRELRERPKANSNEDQNAELAIGEVPEATPWSSVNGGTHLSSTSPCHEIKYYWQSIPHSILPRVEFLFDLTTSMRGAGWAHQIRSIPGPPDYILSHLPSPHPTTRPTVRAYTNRRACLRHNLQLFAAMYLALDILKCMSMRDPYFWGFLDANPLPSHLLSPYLPPSPRYFRLSLRLYRSIVSLATIGAALQAVFTLNALVFVGLFGHNRWPFRLGIHADAWVYPNWYGSPKWVITHGLQGWWGAWWHQIFRFGFEAPTVWLCKQLKWEKKSNKAKMLGTVVAFGLSGVLHASGSYTTWPNTRPMSGSFAFFAMQGVGVFLETTLLKWMEEKGILERTPVFAKRVVTVLWVLVWLSITAPLLVDDFARSGIWLFEPVPFSFLRLIGWGLEGQGALAWRGRLVWWHTGEHWWQSGIVF